MTILTILMLMLAIIACTLGVLVIISAIQGNGIKSIILYVIICIVVMAILFKTAMLYDDVRYAADFKEGTYQMNIEEVIKNCSNDADQLATALYNFDQDTFNIKSNITKVEAELTPKFICSVPREGEDIIIFIDADEVKKMIDNKYIKFVS